MTATSPGATAPASARPAAPLGVLVVDDQAAVREGVARLIASAESSMVCVGTAASGAEALSRGEAVRYEVVVLDADLNGEDGLALIPRFALNAAVLVLTSHGDAATRRRAMQLGALAFIEKHQPAAELLRSIVDVAERRAGRGGGDGRAPLAPNFRPVVDRPT